MKLKDKVAIVTGATAGIGKAIAKTLAKEGAKVVCTGRNFERGAAIVEAITADGGEAVFIPADVTNEEELDELVSKSVEKYRKIDILVNNSGIAYLAPLDSYEQNMWEQVIATNLRGPHLLIKKVMPYLLESKGNIVNISSMSGLKSISGAYAYGPSKAALNSLTKLLAFDYAKQGVRVNAICPGTIETEILACVSEEFLEAGRAATPMGRFGQPEEIAKAVVFFASDDASYITGQTLAVDGGYTA